MNSDLKKLTKAQLIRLLLKKEKNEKAQKQIANEFENPIVSPPKQEESLSRKRVNNYEDLIIEPPEQFRDRQKKRRPPKPTRKPLPPPPIKEHITDRPAPVIKELNLALKGHAKSYEVEILARLAT